MLGTFANNPKLCSIDLSRKNSVHTWIDAPSNRFFQHFVGVDPKGLVARDPVEKGSIWDLLLWSTHAKNKKKVPWAVLARGSVVVLLRWCWKSNFCLFKSCCRHETRFYTWPGWRKASILDVVSSLSSKTTPKFHHLVRPVVCERECFITQTKDSALVPKVSSSL